MTIEKLHLPDTGNSVALFAIASLIGGLGWSGNPTLHFLALLYPFVYIYSRRRLDTLSAVFYYAASTWPISSYEAKRRKIDLESLLDPCTNLRAGWQIFEDAYRIEVVTYGPGQTALQHALSRYNTGDTARGFDNGYVQRVLGALRRQPSPSQSAPEKRR